MKRLTLLIAFSVTFVLLTRAQIRLGIFGGPQSARVIEKNSIPGWDTAVNAYNSPRHSLNIGFLGEVPIGEGHFYFHPGIFYTGKGRDYLKTRFRKSDTALHRYDTVSSSANFYTNYIEVPLNITYKLPLGRKSNFWLSAGPYLSFFYNGKQHTETSTRRVADNDTKYYTTDTKPQVGSGDNTVKTFDGGLNARAGFEIGSVLLTGFLSRGLTNFYTASYGGSFKHQVYGASVGFWLNKAAPVEHKLKDRDHDGIPDKEDACPDVAGVASANGCPDRDGDGIPDKDDKCPDSFGLVKYGGCPIPDTDGDGINDEQDKCPLQPGLAKYGGCPVPDSDGDGINDEEDKCPHQAGVAKYNGCPVPDTDGDGINDEEDACPTVAGTAENKGCPVVKKELSEKAIKAAREILFAYRSDRLMPVSEKALDAVVNILKEDTALHLSIDGYTDNIGNSTYNLQLSQRRAAAVAAYISAKGIAADRLKATGFGQDKPVADNRAEKGRAMNRRVELHLHY